MLGASHLRLAASECDRALRGALDRDWERPAGDLEWNCRRTLDHISDALLFYAAHLATRSAGRRPFVRDGDPDASPDQLLDTAVASAAILAAVVEAAPPTARAFHPAGMADAEGFAAMGCDEILVHTADIAVGLGVAFTPPGDLCAQVRDRLFPWAPTEVDPWAGLRWANGRVALPGRERLGPDWYWQCAPLEEWDGTVRRRTAPPAW